ncbi:MAG: RNA-binding domain protein [Firmicutes bacterium]|nr:RNA-binding domain protein [Bacillota bacterium]
MGERDKILRYYRASGEEETAVRLLDTAEAALKNRKYKLSDFLDPFGCSVAETIIAHYDRLELMLEGGYSGAERVKAAFVDEDFKGEVDFAIDAVSVSWDKRYHQLSHRDVLGALMAMGIKREAFGDIVMTTNGCQILVTQLHTEYVLANLTQIGAAAVSVNRIPLMEIAAREEKVKEVRTTAASLRLDVVAAAGFSVSRTKMAEEIAAKKLKVNWQDAKSGSQIVKPGDILSMRGRGRVEFCEVLGQTKKGRTSIVLKRFY